MGCHVVLYACPMGYHCDIMGSYTSILWDIYPADIIPYDTLRSLMHPFSSEHIPNILPICKVNENNYLN